MEVRATSMTRPMRRSAIPFCCVRLDDTLSTTEVLNEVGAELTTSVRVQPQDREVLLEPSAKLETDSADPADQDTAEIRLALQREDRGVACVVVDNQQKVALATLSSDIGGAPYVHVQDLQRRSGQRKRGGVRSGALPPLDAGKAGRCKRPRERGQGPGKPRHKETGVHAMQAWQGGVAKMVVLEESLVRKETT
ncbi:unnamed protein product [Closterium sp. NIES-53]